MNPAIKVMENAVEGPLAVRASEIEKELEKGAKKPFDEVIRVDTGDCHAMGQVPITFIRQVLALVALPELSEDPRFPEDVKRKAKDILTSCRGGSVGSYPDSPGIEIVRKHAAQYIQKRDGGVPSDWQNVFISAGASDGIKTVLKLLIENVDGKKPGVMIPIPQHPFYTASLAKFSFEQVGYYLNEEKGWSVDVEELERSYNEAKTHCAPRAIVIINPGCPSGQVLSRENIEDIIKFAHNYNLFLFADEVYQDNVYTEGCKFHSLKKVLIEMGPPYSEMELASFMSCSKGYMGECGMRGGYGEVINLDPLVNTMLLNCISTTLCPTVLGQAVMDCVVSPPQPGEPSYQRFKEEKESILRSLALTAKMVTDTFNSIPGMSCNPVQGAICAFPQLKLPAKAIAKAKSMGQCPSTFYAFQLLENTGICVVPGDCVGQKPNTYHFRTTILPQPEKMKGMLERFRKFHLKFLEDYK